MLTQPITIRRAINADIPFLRAMIWEALLASPTFLAHYGVETIQQSEERHWSTWTEELGHPAFVALDATGQKLGAITLRAKDENKPISGWQIGVGVEDEVRGQGVGRQLVERAIAFAREQGASYIKLIVDPTNTPAIVLYQRMGFIEVGMEDQVLEMRIDLQDSPS